MGSAIVKCFPPHPQMHPGVVLPPHTEHCISKMPSSPRCYWVPGGHSLGQKTGSGSMLSGSIAINPRMLKNTVSGKKNTKHPQYTNKQTS